MSRMPTDEYFFAARSLMKLNVNPKNSYTFVLHPSHKKLNETIKSVFLLILATFAMVFSSCDGVLFETKEEITIQIYDTYVEEEITKGTTIAPNHGCLIFKAPEESPIEMPLSFELSIDINGTAGPDWTYVEFGDWPQTIKADDVTVDESISTEVGMFTYYMGSDGAWYAKIKENCYRSNHYSNGQSVASSFDNSYKYFKVEPIKWRVLTANYRGRR